MANKCIHILSYVGNKGLIDRSWNERFGDKNVWYHAAYLIVCIIGLMHPLIYSALVCVVYLINLSNIDYLINLSNIDYLILII
jgi:hypothetical protein